MCLIYGCPENFQDSLTTPMSTFLKILRDFVPMVQFLGPPYILFLYQHSFAEILDCSFGCGLRNPNFREGEAVGGRGWYHSKKRCGVSRPSIVTFPLIFTRFRDIAAFVLQHATFSLPYLVSPKIPMFPWEQVDRLLATKSEGVGLIVPFVRAISFRDFQPMWSQSTNVTDRQTDRQTDERHAIARPCFALKCIVR